MTCSSLADERSEALRLAPKYQAEVEVRLWDLTRVDLMNDEYAIEVDWAHKWAEGIGQSLYYAAVSGKKPAVLLLIKGNPRTGANPFHIYRAQTVCAKHGIKLYLEIAHDH